MFKFSNIPMYKCLNAQMFKSSNDQMFKCSNVHMSNVEYQVSNVNKVKLLSERTSGVPPVIFIMECHRTNTDTNINDIQYPEYAKCFLKGRGFKDIFII